MTPARRVLLRRIPVAMITGSTGKTTTTRMLAHVLTRAGYRVGFTSTDGVVIGGEYLVHGDCAGYADAGRVLSDRSVTAAVLETARGSLRRDGLYLDRCAVAALLNVGREQIGIDGIDSVEQMAAHKRQVVDAARDRVVLNADDTQCVNIARDYPAHKLALFSLNVESSVVASHVAKGGLAYVAGKDDHGDAILRLEGATTRTLMPISSLPSCMNGLFPQNIANALAAAALAEGMGVPIDVIREALTTFENSVGQTPGRFNFIEDYTVRILVDRAVSVPASLFLAKSIGQIRVPGRKICVMDNVGNRPDWHYREIAAALAPVFDDFVCFETEELLRTRQAGEVARLLRDGLIEAGIASERIRVAPDQEAAVALLADLAAAGDFAVILQVKGDPHSLLAQLAAHLAAFRKRNEGVAHAQPRRQLAV